LKKTIIQSIAPMSLHALSTVAEVTFEMIAGSIYKVSFEMHITKVLDGHHFLEKKTLAYQKTKIGTNTYSSQCTYSHENVPLVQNPCSSDIINDIWMSFQPPLWDG
jgi:hypothetical protein